MTNQEIIQAMKDALMDLETSSGLYCNDGKVEAQWQLEFKSIEKLSEAIQSMEVNDDSK